MKKEPEKLKEEPSSMFQRQRVDMLLGELMRKFPLPLIPNPNAPSTAPEQAVQSRVDVANVQQSTPSATAPTQTSTTTSSSSSNVNGSSNLNGDFKPPEKRAK